MLLKWLAALFQHGLVSILALITAIAAVWWVEPTTNGGIAFLLSLTFVLALAALELIRKLARLFQRTAPTVEAPTPTTDAEPEAEAPPDIPRRRKRRRSRS